MVLSYDTLRLEPVWRAQFTPPALLWLAQQLRAYYGQTANEIGSPGDNRHVSGGHRSRRWLLTSEWAENRGYTTTHPDDRAGDDDWYCAIDIDPGDQAELIAMCRRLDAAVRAGELEECWEWYGNLGGDTRVDGWNNLENRLATSDSSHLGHLHMTFRRRFANSMPVMQRALAILTGDPLMATPKDVDALIWRMEGLVHGRTAVAGGPLKGEPIELNIKAAEQDAAIAELAKSVGLSPEQLAEVKSVARAGAIEAIEASAEVFAAAIPDHLADQVAGLLAARSAAALRAGADELDGGA